MLTEFHFDLSILKLTLHEAQIKLSLSPKWHLTQNICTWHNIWGPFEKFRDLPYYSELELCGGAVMVSFSKYLPWQVMHFLQCSTHFLKTCCRLFATSFRRIVEQVVLTSWALWAQSSLFMVSLCLCRLGRWVVGFLIHFFPSWTHKSII
jgi:hypothetical protein